MNIDMKLELVPVPVSDIYKVVGSYLFDFDR